MLAADAGERLLPDHLHPTREAYREVAISQWPTISLMTSAIELPIRGGAMGEPVCRPYDRLPMPYELPKQTGGEAPPVRE
jgi:hypothetical protein